MPTNLLKDGRLMPTNLIRVYIHMKERFRVQGLGFRVQGLGFRVWGSGFRV